MPPAGDAPSNGRLKDVGEDYAYSVQSSRSTSDSDENGEVVMRRVPSGEPTLRSSVSHVVMGSSLNVLLVFVPLAVLASPEFCDWGHSWTFTFAMAALIPFAERVSFVTEDVAKYTSDTVGGLLNASFGNITELVVCIFMLKTGGSMMLRLVQVSMLGSVLSNLLLVLGSAFLVGGIRHKEQVFKPAVSVMYSVLLLFAVLGISLPLALAATHTGAGDTHQEGDETVDGGEAPLWLSRFIAVVMLFIYGLLIFFQLKTHSHLLEGMEDDDDEPGVLGLWIGVLWLAVITFFISMLSDYIVDAIEGAAKGMGTPLLFLAGILVPIVGNAAEHFAAVTFAWRNKMEISLGSAVGSAVQIAVFVIPLCVVLGWAMGEPMSLNFHVFETVVLLLSVLAVAVVLVDGRSHWLKGAVLLFAYVLIAASFWAHKDPEELQGLDSIQSR
jgi:Ca2+:H+ antiporter